MCEVGHQVTFTTRDVVLEKLHDCNADITNENGCRSYRTDALALNSCRKHQSFYQSSASFQLEKGWWTTGAGQALPTASASFAGGDPQFCRPEVYDTVLRGAACKQLYYPQNWDPKSPAQAGTITWVHAMPVKPGAGPGPKGETSYKSTQ